LSQEQVMAFDYGTKYIGVAVGNRVTQTSRGLSVLFVQKNVWKDLDVLVQDWEPGGFVVGLPLNMDGSKNPMTGRAKKFCEQLKEKYQIPVFEVDERLSTWEAKENILTTEGFRKMHGEKVQKHSAEILLDQWFQEKNKE
jgi:putative holliday junction resolvase